MSTLPPTATATGNDDMQDITFKKKGCNCFCMPCFRAETSSYGSWWWEGMSSPEKKEEQWWFRRCKKVREWSEIVAGPKWKTFIRRFKKRAVSCTYAKHGSFHYDPLSYALNFDDGTAFDDDEDGYGYAGFSARFASVPSSMELAKDAPAFT